MRRGPFRLQPVVLTIALCGTACSKEPDPRPSASTATPSTAPAEPKPVLLYLPDGGDLAPPRAPGHELLPGPWGTRGGRCPPEMVDVRGQFCIDRFEASLVDARTGRELSPYYAPSRSHAKAQYERWRNARAQAATEPGRRLDVPELPAWELEQEFEPKASVRPGAIPSGYVSGIAAELACRNSAKRLCRPEEWLMACRGARGQKFPYGATYDAGRCNVHRESHPAQVLHKNPSIHHLDPRLNLVRVDGQPLLRPTGASPECGSQWGNDTIYDMVGNLDEWVDDPDGLFVGGFYARSTREGCDAKVSSHPREYYDYSLGVRCCR